MKSCAGHIDGMKQQIENNSYTRVAANLENMGNLENSGNLKIVKISENSGKFELFWKKPGKLREIEKHET